MPPKTKDQTPAIETWKHYTSQQIAQLAGRNDSNGLKSTSAFLSNNDIGYQAGRIRLVPGDQVADVVERLKNAKRGNPWNSKPEEAPPETDTNRKEAKKKTPKKAKA